MPKCPSIGAEVEVETSDEVDNLASSLENFVRPLRIHLTFSRQPISDGPDPECSYRSASAQVSDTSRSKTPKKSTRWAANEEDRPSTENYRGRLRSKNHAESLKAATSSRNPRAANPRGRPKAAGRPRGTNSRGRSQAAADDFTSSSDRSCLGSPSSSSFVTQETPEIIGVHTAHGVRRICVKWRPQGKTRYLIEEELTEELRLLLKDYLEKELEDIQTTLSTTRLAANCKSELTNRRIKAFRNSQDSCFSNTTFFKNVGIDNVEKKVKV